MVVAAMIARHSTTGRPVELALRSSDVIVSGVLMVELEGVFRRTKFDRYSSLQTRIEYLGSFAKATKPVYVIDVVTDCRDPKDNMLLALALSGRADLIITGDLDLLVLHPWRGIPILTPSAYLERPL